jgi:molybdate transport system regulatory protein
MTRRAPLPPVRIRVNLGVAAFGPGKADLLEKITETGSISGAARLMRMSF